MHALDFVFGFVIVLAVSLAIWATVPTDDHSCQRGHVETLTTAWGTPYQAFACDVWVLNHPVRKP